MTVLIENSQDKVEAGRPLYSLIEKVIHAAIASKKLPFDCEVSVNLVDNRYIALLNKEYRGIDAPTDVLSFALLEGEEYADTNEDGEVILGDIVISLERAKEQAEEYGHTFEREVAFLALHGALHLLGYDHIEERDRRLMRKKEEEILESLGLARE